MNGDTCQGGSTLSAFLFSSEIKEYFDKHGGSYRGYQGPHIALGVHFDFDGKSAQDDLMDLITRVYSDSIADGDCQIWFSGNKGFHAIVGLSHGVIGPSNQTSALVKECAADYAARYASWDTSVYDATRGMRINNSRHQKTGLFKIELHPTELWAHDMDSIKKLAKSPRNIRDKKTISEMVEHNLRRFNSGN